MRAAKMVRPSTGRGNKIKLSVVSKRTDEKSVIKIIVVRNIKTPLNTLMDINTFGNINKIKLRKKPPIPKRISVFENCELTDLL